MLQLVETKGYRNKKTCMEVK